MGEVEYADMRDDRSEAIRSLAAHLGVTELRALNLLESGEAGEEIRSRQPRVTGREALRSLEARRYGPSA
jgi:hypothetical protein